MTNEFPDDSRGARTGWARKANAAADGGPGLTRDGGHWKSVALDLVFNIDHLLRKLAAAERNRHRARQSKRTAKD